VPDAVRLEICCGSLEDARAAEEGGADRIELCSALCVGGLTPSIGALAEARARVALPVMAMIRPRAAGFRYEHSEIAVMERDVEAAVDAGAQGVVFGALGADSSIDAPACRRLRAAARDREVVFHRAFDLTPDAGHALEELIDLGFTRVLTSGQRPTALEGTTILKRLIEQARGRIEILPGGGIRAHNVRQIVDETGCRQVHLSAFGTKTDPASGPGQSFLADHLPSDQYARTDPQKVREVVKALARG
jgi:copper homeostasis protein